MSGQITDSKINEIRDRTDIVDLVSQYVSLKRSGANHSGLCPFHSEKTPSFSVNAARQFYHCFGCGVGGDVFSFVMKMEGLAFPEAVRRLADRCGIELEEKILTPEEERRQQQRERLFHVNKIAGEYFHQLLMESPTGEPARKYLKHRGYGRKAATDYQLGFAVDAWGGLKSHLEQRGQKAEDARILGLIRPSKQGGDYDLFRGRLIVPIFDLNGRVVAFAGRVLDNSKPKYINSPESPIYHKSQVLFGLFQARHAMRQAGDVLVVEGYFDQLALYRAGFPNVVATCGTALTAEHAKLLKRYVQKVLLLFDQDAAGRQATFKAMLALQEEGLPSQVVALPTGDDPDSFLQKNSADAFRQRLDAARPAMDVFMEDCLAGTDGHVELRVQAAEKVLAVVASLSSELEQDLYLKKLARLSGIELDLLKKKLPQVQYQQARFSSKNEVAPGPEDGYPLPEEANTYQDFEAYSGPEPQSSPAASQAVAEYKTLSFSEENLVGLMLLGYLSRKQFDAAGGLGLLQHPDAIAVAKVWLGLSAEQNNHLEQVLEHLSPQQNLMATKLAADESGRFSENAQKMADDCLWALEKQLLKKRIDALQRQLLPAAESAGDSAQADIYRNELTRMLAQMKRRRS